MKIFGFLVIPAKAGIQVFEEKWIPDYYLGNDDEELVSDQ
jgi:hypothetical protein